MTTFEIIYATLGVVFGIIALVLTALYHKSQDDLKEARLQRTDFNNARREWLICAESILDIKKSAECIEMAKEIERLKAENETIRKATNEIEREKLKLKQRELDIEEMRVNPYKIN